MDIEVEEAGDIKMSMYSKLPQVVKIKNKKYIVRTDFRLFIKFEEDMTQQGRNDAEVIIKTLQKFYPAFFEIIENNLLEEAVDQFLWFYSCGKAKNNSEGKQNDLKKGKRKFDANNRAFDYEYDSDLIWAAFYDKGFDLTVDKIHWWKFKAIWNSLPANCELKKVIGYRCYDGDDKNLLELKELYKLPLTIGEINNKKRQDNIYEQLKNMSKK